MRRGSIGLVAGLVALVAFSIPVPPASAACGGTQHFRAKKRRVPGRPPLAIGDSVMLGAVDELAAAGFEVDVRGCRQMSEGVRTIAAHKRHGLPDVVVVALGANLNIKPSEIRRALRILGPSRTLALVTPREDGGGSGSDARVVRRAGRRHPGRVKVLDWVAYSAGHGGWFAGDGLHLGPGGARGFTRLLSRAFRFAAPLKTRWKRLGLGPADDSVSPGRAASQSGP
jgi:hypothetical protein